MIKLILLIHPNHGSDKLRFDKSSSIVCCTRVRRNNAAMKINAGNINFTT